MLYLHCAFPYRSTSVLVLHGLVPVRRRSSSATPIIAFLKSTAVFLFYQVFRPPTRLQRGVRAVPRLQDCRPRAPGLFLRLLHGHASHLRSVGGRRGQHFVLTCPPILAVEGWRGSSTPPGFGFRAGQRRCGDGGEVRLSGRAEAMWRWGRSNLAFGPGRGDVEMGEK